MIVYIVVREFTGGGVLVESVWSKEELAISAKLYHAMDSNQNVGKFHIIKRELDKAKV